MISAACRLALVASLAFAGCSKSKPAEPAVAPPPAPAAAVAAPTPAPAPAGHKAMDPEAAKKLIASGAVVVDVRTPEEFAEGHLPMAVNIPIEDFEKRMPEVAKLVASDKSKPLVVYCASGQRAGKAKQTLDGDGYSNVVNGGGLDDLQ